MKQEYAQEWPQFFTATIQERKHLLKEDKCKNIIVDALNFLVTEGNVTINGFVPIAIGSPIIYTLFGNQKEAITYKKYKTVL